jgi:hypothetical protein
MTREISSKSTSEILTEVLKETILNVERTLEQDIIVILRAQSGKRSGGLVAIGRLVEQFLTILKANNEKVSLFI